MSGSGAVQHFSPVGNDPFMNPGIMRMPAEVVGGTMPTAMGGNMGLYSVPLLSSPPSAQTLFLGEGHGVPPPKLTTAVYDLPDSVYSTFKMMAREEYSTLDDDERRAQGIPVSVRSFHSLLPLDNSEREARNSLFGFHHCIYKATRAADGSAVAMRRVFNVNSSVLPTAKAAVDAWEKVEHAGVLCPKEVFYSQDDFVEPSYDPSVRPKPSPSLMFVYDYHPMAETIGEKHFSFSHSPPGTVPEGLIWSYLVQLCTAVRVIHSAGLAARCIDSSKVLVTTQNRLRISSVGIADALHPDNQRQSKQEHQYADIAAIGRLGVCIACSSDSADPSMPGWMDAMSQQYSADLKNFLFFLLNPQGLKGFPKPSGPYLTIYDVLHFLMPRIVGEVDSLYRHSDLLLTHMRRQMDNGRLFRILSKLMYVHDRTSSADESWADGEKYILRLYLDHLFHQVDSEGSPVIDLGFVIMSLNKLDAGNEEKVLLASRDKATLLAVSYRELKGFAEAAFFKLLEGGADEEEASFAPQGHSMSGMIHPSPPMMPSVPPPHALSGMHQQPGGHSQMFVRAISQPLPPQMAWRN